MKRVGFIVNSRRPEWRALRRGMRPWHMAGGWPDTGSPMYSMRYRWVAREVNADPSSDLHYELFKPWKDYDAVVFLKSMEARCADFADELRLRGRTVVFEANVDYYSEADPGQLPPGLAPTAKQRDLAIRMTANSNAVIASSRRLAEICRGWNGCTTWVPDNIPPRLVPPASRSTREPGEALSVWWSGMPAKATDLLAIDPVLQKLGRRVHLHLVSRHWEATLKSLPPEKAEPLRSLLSQVPHTVHRFTTVPALLRLYSRGPGVIISPRFLDNPYNLSHSEWKISLGLACGLPALASPQPSYLDVAERCRHPAAVTICSTDEEWETGFEHALAGRDHAEAASAARDVVLEHYSTPVVARRHAAAVRAALEAA